MSPQTQPIRSRHGACAATISLNSFLSISFVGITHLCPRSRRASCLISACGASPVSLPGKCMGPYVGTPYEYIKSPQPSTHAHQQRKKRMRKAEYTTPTQDCPGSAAPCVVQEEANAQVATPHMQTSMSS